jgi:hypothetical protein
MSGPETATEDRHDEDDLTPEQERWLCQLRWIQQRRGYRLAWISYTFGARFGRWLEPTFSDDDLGEPPDHDVAMFVVETLARFRAERAVERAAAVPVLPVHEPPPSSSGKVHLRSALDVQLGPAQCWWLWFSRYSPQRAELAGVAAGRHPLLEWLNCESKSYEGSSIARVRVNVERRSWPSIEYERVSGSSGLRFGLERTFCFGTYVHTSCFGLQDLPCSRRWG